MSLYKIVDQLLVLLVNIESGGYYFLHDILDSPFHLLVCKFPILMKGEAVCDVVKILIHELIGSSSF